MHQRTAICNAVAVALLDATDALTRVFPDRTIDHLMSEFPVIAIHAPSEDSSLEIDPRELERDATFIIECMVEDDDNIRVAMNDMAEQIEAAMNVDYTFGLVCFQSKLTGTDLEAFENGDREIGILEMTYLFSYRTDAFVAPTGGDSTSDYDRSTVAIDLEGSQATADQTNDAFEQDP